jgi:membrane protein
MATVGRRVAEEDRGRLAERPGQIPARGWRDILLRVKAGVKRDQVPLLSAGVAFYALLSLFPAIIAIVSVYGLVANPDTVRRQIEQSSKLLPAGTTRIVRDQIAQITGGAGRALSLALVLSILTALWSASSGMKALITGVNMAYGEPQRRGFLKLRGLALLVTLGAMVVATVALALLVGLPAVASHLPTVVRLVLVIGRWPLLAALVAVGLAVLYRLAPDRDQPRWSWLSWGSAAATLLWIVASVGFSFYASHVGNYNRTYGALGGIVILLFWLFLSAFAVLVGAELNAEMELQTTSDTTVGAGRPMGERRAWAADHVAAAPAPGRRGG